MVAFIKTGSIISHNDLICLKDLIDMTLRKLDVDKDGRVSMNDWSITVRKEPLMMEAFGPCLPTKKKIDAFMKKVESES